MIIILKQNLRLFIYNYMYTSVVLKAQTICRYLAGPPWSVEMPIKIKLALSFSTLAPTFKFPEGALL